MGLESILSDFRLKTRNDEDFSFAVRRAGLLRESVVDSYVLSWILATGTRHNLLLLLCPNVVNRIRNHQVVCSIPTPGSAIRSPTLVRESGASRPVDQTYSHT